MKQIISSVNGWVTEITQFLQGLIVLGVVVGILFNDYFISSFLWLIKGNQKQVNI